MARRAKAVESSARATDPPSSTSQAAPANGLIQLRLGTLLVHPRQHEFVDPPSEADIQDFAASLNRVGQRVPIDVANDRRTILCGHTRLLAAKLIGWAVLDVRIHAFPADSDEALELLLNDNLDRRQLDKLSLARAYLALLAIEQKKRPRGWLNQAGAERRQLRDVLAERFGVCGRQLDRLARLTKLPLAVQRKISANRLTVNDAERLFSLEPNELAEAAAALARAIDKKSCKAVILKFCPIRPPGATLFADAATDLLVKSLERSLPDLRRHGTQIRFDDKQRKLVHESAKLLTEVLNNT